MAFPENLSVFLSDFAVPCVAGAVNFQGMFDQADEDFNLSGVGAQSRQYKLTYATSDVSLNKASAVTVDGVAYTVRNKPNQIDDGKFSVAELTKI